MRDLSHKQVVVKKGGGLTSSAISAFSSALKRIPVGRIVNTAIDALPVELHLPGGYQYCGPGTKLKERLARKDPGINQLDKACKEHDIAYSKYSDTANRSVADQILAKQAWRRVKSSDASVSERAAALAVVGAMKAKRAIGGGRRRKGRKHVSKKRGGNIRRRRRRASKSKQGIWKVKKSGNGLYLRPYQNVY